MIYFQVIFVCFYCLKLAFFYFFFFLILWHKPNKYHFLRTCPLWTLYFCFINYHLIFKNKSIVTFFFVFLYCCCCHVNSIYNKGKRKTICFFLFPLFHHTLFMNIFNKYEVTKNRKKNMEQRKKCIFIFCI